MTTRAGLGAALAGPGPGRPDAGRPGGGPGDRARPVARFGGLLLILVFTYLLSALTEGGLVSAIEVVLFLVVVLLALRNGRLHRRAVRFIAVGLLVGTVVASTLQLVAHDKPAAGAADLWTALVLLLAIILILGRILARPEITVQSIYGAISAYMILGLMFAAIYAAVYHFDGNMFFAHQQPGPIPTSTVPVLQLHHADHARVRGLHRGRVRWAGPGRARGDGRPDLPGHSGRPAGSGLPRHPAGSLPARPAPASRREAGQRPASQHARHGPAAAARHDPGAAQPRRAPPRTGPGRARPGASHRPGCPAPLSR